MTTDELYEKSPVLAHLLQQSQVAVLLGGRATNKHGDNAVAFTADMVLEVVEAAEWEELGQGRWAWVLRLIDSELLFGGICWGETPGAEGYRVYAHWVAGGSTDELRPWFEQWVDHRKVAGSTLCGLR